MLHCSKPPRGGAMTLVLRAQFLLQCSMVILLCGGVLAQKAPGTRAHVDSWVEKATSSGNEAEFLVLLREQVDLAPAAALVTKEAKGSYVFKATQELAHRTQAGLLSWLEERKIAHRSFSVVNAVWVRAGRPVVDLLAERPEVWRIEGNPWLPGLSATQTSPSAVIAVPTALAIEWGISFTNADQVWALGFTGQGIVVGGQDTGYEWNHPALINQYRGYNGTTASHDFNWHDSIHSGGGSCGADSPFPCDDNNHGTHTMGTAVGDDGGANQIGMAPGARWICSRNMDQGNGSPATYLESFEFFLAPYPVTGNPTQGNPALAPDVTTNSWLCPPSEGCSTTSLLLACQVQRAAGIMTVVAAGNSGSNCSTVSWPAAIYDEVYTVGAHRSNGNLSGFSSRGPVTVDGSNRMKPDIASPGQGIRSSVRGGGYAGGWSGTSMATPHVAGAVALLWSAHPDLRGQITLTEQILNDSADPVSSSSCGSSGVPNNLYGHGRVDVLAAVNSVRSANLSGSAPATCGPGGVVNHTVVINNSGYVADSYTVNVSASSFAGLSFPATVGPIPAGGSESFIVSLTIPSGAVQGASDIVSVSVASTGYSLPIPPISLTTNVTTSLPTLSIAQPGGPGTPVFFTNTNLVPGTEYWNVFSLELCPSGVGTGPLLGLCSTDLTPLLLQFQSPLGAVPFHFIAPGTTVSHGPFGLPFAVSFEGVCLTLTPACFLNSPAVGYTVL